MTTEGIPHPALAEVTLAAALHALGDPARLAIVRIAARGDELPCAAFEIGLPKATASRHFQVLREAGLIRQRQHGTQRLTSLRGEEFRARFPGLLEAVLEADARSGRGGDPPG